VARELSALGEQPRIEDGGVSWEGDARSVMRANLWLRTASRVLVRVARFHATAFYELEKRAKRIPWAQFLGTGVRPDFRVTARKSRLYHSDAIAERLANSVGRRKADGGQREPDGGTQLFVVRMARDELTISADTSGDLLHMRGYRQAVAKAPLRETLAAALLMAAEWRGDTPLLDPFCGSGTIPIEGALLARDIPPGRGRRFAFMDWPTYDGAIWSALLADSAARARETPPVPILGSDRDRGAITAAIANAARAGVAGDIAFSVRALSAIEPPESRGLVATNPPYGVRVSDGSDVRNLYAQLGNVLRRRWKGCRVALYAPDSRLIQATGLITSEVIRTSNGGIRVSAVVGTVEDGTP
jgi:putative N6-adenine-specific DNA methylase